MTMTNDELERAVTRLQSQCRTLRAEADQVRGWSETLARIEALQVRRAVEEGTVFAALKRHGFIRFGGVVDEDALRAFMASIEDPSEEKDS